MKYQLRIIRIFITIAIIINGLVTCAQAIDYTPVYRSLNTDRSFRFSYENDFFSASDRDYTQGVYIEVIHPSFKKFPLSKLTWKPAAFRRKFGVALESNGYTPNNIDKPGIQYNDRPYASTLLLKTFNTALNQKARKRVTNTITIGILGPWAGGKEIQSSIHRWIGYTKPEGWHNQVHNEPVLNYQLNYEKTILGNNNNFLFTAQAMARAGNLSTKAAIGPALMIGRFLNPYIHPHIGPHVDPHIDPYIKSHQKNNKLHWYFYDHASLNLVGYDATLQGGLLDKRSPYTIKNSQLNRIVFQNRFGLVISYKTLTFEYWQSFMTKEFKTGIEPKTGGVQLAFKL